MRTFFRRTSGRLKRVRPDNFVLLMVAVAVAGLLVPAPGAMEAWGVLTQIGIALIFFLHGAAFPREVIVENARRLGLHGLIQGQTFVIFPVIGVVLYFGLAPVVDETLRAGIFFLCALPSTVSSSVALTAAARGNVPVAVFNASLSGLIGLVVTPALVGLVLSTAAGHFDYLEALIDIAIVLLLPFTVGQLARPLIGKVVARHRARIGLVDKGVILLIVYGAFASSTAAGVWSLVGTAPLLVTVLIVFLLLALVIFGVRRLCRGLDLSAPDEAAVVFCGATKSLATGAPIAQILFAGSGVLGLILLPVMIYHQLQLIVCASLTRGYADRTPAPEGTAP